MCGRTVTGDSSLLELRVHIQRVIRTEMAAQRSLGNTDTEKDSYCPYAKNIIIVSVGMNDESINFINLKVRTCDHCQT